MSNVSKRAVTREAAWMDERGEPEERRNKPRKRFAGKTVWPPLGLAVRVLTLATRMVQSNDRAFEHIDQLRMTACCLLLQSSVRPSIRLLLSMQHPGDGGRWRCCSYLLTVMVALCPCQPRICNFPPIPVSTRWWHGGTLSSREQCVQ